MLFPLSLSSPFCPPTPNVHRILGLVQLGKGRPDLSLAAINLHGILHPAHLGPVGMGGGGGGWHTHKKKFTSKNVHKFHLIDTRTLFSYMIINLLCRLLSRGSVKGGMSQPPADQVRVPPRGPIPRKAAEDADGPDGRSIAQSVSNERSHEYLTFNN